MWLEVPRKTNARNMPLYQNLNVLSDASWFQEYSFLLEKHVGVWQATKSASGLALPISRSLQSSRLLALLLLSLCPTVPTYIYSLQPLPHKCTVQFIACYFPTCKDKVEKHDRAKPRMAEDSTGLRRYC